MAKKKSGKGKAEKTERAEQVDQPAFEPAELRSEPESAEFDKLQTRLRRIEGQVRGVQSMLEENRDSADIIMQLAAIKSAVNKVAMNVLERRSKAIAAELTGSEKQIKELLHLAEQLTK